MRLKSLKSVIVLVLAALIAAPWPSLPAPSPKPRHQPADEPSLLAAFHLPVYSDFDGDHKLDRAELFSSGVHKSIHVSLSSSWVTSLTFDSETADRGSLQIVDIDHDNDDDLVWVSQNKFQPPVVWINNGLGHFDRDTGSHAAELSALLRSDSDAGFSQGQRVSYSLGAPTPSFPSDLELVNKPQIGDLHHSSARHTDRRHYQGVYLTYLRKRGPPESLSQASRFHHLTIAPRRNEFNG